MASKQSKHSPKRRIGPATPVAAPLAVTWLQGRHARLRPIEPTDVPSIQRSLKSPPTTLWPWFPAQPSKKVDVEQLARLAVDADNPALIVESRAGRSRGIIAIHVDGMRARLAVASADRRFWRDACARDAVNLMVSAAFRVLPLQRIELIIFTGCKGAIECARKAGFQQEGVLRCCPRSERSFDDCVVMSVVRA